MMNSSHDPVARPPNPPTDSDYPSSAPPSPFPWSIAHAPATSRSNELSSYFPAPNALLTPPREKYAALLPPPRPLARPGRPEHLDLSSNASYILQSLHTPPSDRLRSRTPSGFEYLDWGESLAADFKPQPRNFDWEVYGPELPGTPVSLTKASSRQTYKRRLGPTEASYYLGSRGDDNNAGVNDMYLHIGFQAERKLVQKERIVSIWTELLRRHTLLGVEVEYKDVDEVFFVHTPLLSEKEARSRARHQISFVPGQDGKEYLDRYLNGPRTLSDEQLAKLVITTPEVSFESGADTIQGYDFFLLSTHFLGDGMALHTTANEFFTLLADASPDDDVETNIESVLAAQAASKASTMDNDDDGDEVAHVDLETLAPPMESKVVTPDSWGRMAWACARVDFNRTQAKLIGGQAFARDKLGKRHTLIPTLCYESADTKTILAACKKHGVTIASAVFALANVAYIRSVESGVGTDQRDERLPMMLYSALNVRPWLKKDSADWYCIAINYYNIILPSFLPASCTPAETFWLRAQSTKSQTSAVVKSKWLSSRAKLMALERERRSIGFAREDDRRKALMNGGGVEKPLLGLGISLGPAVVLREAPQKPTPAPVVEPKKIAAPSVALMGVSMLGNLDGMYSHASYHGIKMHTLTTGSRQRPGALLLFAYTFAGKLWFSLGYDRNGFKEGVIDAWWNELKKGVDEFLLV